MEEIRLVEGSNRSCLYDLPRRNYHFVPVQIGSLIDKLEGQPVDIANLLDEEEKSWLSYFEEEEFIVKVPKVVVNNFSKLKLDWESPAIITNAIIEDGIFLEKALSYIDQLFCKFLVLKCETVPRLKEILINNFKVSNYQNLDVILKQADTDGLTQLREEFPILGNVYLNAKPNSELEDQEDVFYLKKGEKRPVFTVNIETFTEAQSQHLYYNRKLFIGSTGLIKNAPESKDLFGNIEYLEKANELLEIVASEEFQKYWFVSKNNCNVCQDCEFKYMCLDARAPALRKNGKWQYAEECQYNPYISKWKGEEGYLSLNNSGVRYVNDAYSIDHEMIELINEELWT